MLISKNTRLVIATVAIISVLGGCGGKGIAPDPVNSATGFQDMYVQDDSALMAQLQATLAAEFERLGIDPTKVPVRAPADDANAVFDLEARLLTTSPPYEVELTWTERIVGDYDQNSEVNISDLTPLVIYYGQTVEYDDPALHDGFEFWPSGDPDDGAGGTLNWRKARVDGDNNGEINLSDITPIVLHWNESLDGYRISRAGPDNPFYSELPNPEDAFSPLTIERPDNIDPSAPVRYTFIDEFQELGEYCYYVKPYDVIGDDEGTGSNFDCIDTLVADIEITNLEPPYAGKAPLVVSFNAADSKAINNTIVKYEWDWQMEGDDEDNFAADEEGIFPVASHTYALPAEPPGIYFAAVRVTDGQGKTDIASIGLEVLANQPPVAHLTAEPPLFGLAPLTVGLDASNSFDPDGAIVDYEWDFDGDGLFNEPGNDEAAARGNAITQYTYTAVGEYNPAVRVTDNDGADATVSLEEDTGEQIRVGDLPVLVLVTTPDPPEDVEAPLTVIFDASESYDPDDGTGPGAGITKWEFNFGAGGGWEDYDLDSTAEYEYTVVNSYQAAVRITDNEGSTATAQVDVRIGNPPIAELQATPLSGNQPLEVTFDASESSDPGGSIVKFVWDWDGDGIFEYDSGTTSIVQYTYEEPGEYNATVKVYDNDGLTDTQSVTETHSVLITVSNTPPVADISADQTVGNQPMTVNFDASNSSDADGSIVKYEFDFDEGSGWEDYGIASTAEHLFADDGSYEVQVRVTDNDNATDTHMVVITVNNLTPSADLQADPVAGEPPLTVSFDASGSTDSDGTIEQYDYDWDSNGEYDLLNGGATPSYEYTTSGDYIATVRVTDDDGGQDTEQSPEIVVNIAPTADLQADPTSGEAPLEVTFDATGSTDTDGAVVQFDYDWNGDGTYDLIDGGQTPQYTYNTRGIYNATVRITDDDGATDTVSEGITVHGWMNETVESDGHAGLFTSIVIDTLNVPHISFVTWPNIKHTYFNGTSWQTQNVHSTDSDSGWTSIALDSSDNPRVSFYHFSYTYLKYAYYTGSSWQIDVVDSDGSVGRWTSVAVDSANHPHISYQDWTNKDLKYAYNNGTSWEVETVDSTGWVGSLTSIKLDTSGYPHISYWDYSNRALKYAYYNGSSWQLVTVDNAINVGGESTSIELDSDGNPHISYYDRTNLNLKYANYTGSSWQLFTVDSDGQNGEHSSLALDTSGNPHISYNVWEPYYDLRYAYHNGTSWQIVTVDSTGNVGRYNGISLDSSQNPHISYFDDTNGDLKYTNYE